MAQAAVTAVLLAGSARRSKKMWGCAEQPVLKWLVWPLGPPSQGAPWVWTGKSRSQWLVIQFFPCSSFCTGLKEILWLWPASIVCVWAWLSWLMAAKSMACQGRLWDVSPLSSTASTGSRRHKGDQLSGKYSISATSTTSGHPRRGSACCLPLTLRCCWLKN